jgi:hypothetical protein
MLLAIFLPTASHSQIIFDRYGIAVHQDDPEAIDQVINVSNEGQDAVAFRVAIRAGELPGEQLRDDRGGPDEMEYEWRDSNEEDGPIYDWIDIIEWDGTIDLRANDDDSLYGPFDLAFVANYYGHDYDEIFIDANGFATFLRTALFPFYNNFERLPNGNPGDDVRTPPRTFMACNFQDIDPSRGGHIYYWCDESMAIITWDDIPHFGIENGENWTFQMIITADGLIKYQYRLLGSYDNRPDIIIGLQNEDRDLGFTCAYNVRDYLEEEMAIAIGPPGAWVNWLSVDPREGEFAGGSDQDVVAAIDPGDLENGYYFATLIFMFPDLDQTMQIPVLLSLGASAGGITGVVRDASNNDLLAGARVVIDDFAYLAITDDQGEFSYENIPPGPYSITVEAENFNLWNREDVNVEAGEVTELEVGMLHGRFLVNRRAINQQLVPDTDVDVPMVASNPGNAAVHFTVDRRLVGEANADPFELRRSYNIGADRGDDRIYTATFAFGNIYVAGAAGNDTNKIYVFSPEGEFLRQFNQVGTARYGIRDFAFDGTLIWGSGETEIYGYDEDGVVQRRFRGPYNPTNNLAWDDENRLLYCSGATTTISAIDLDGNVVGQPLQRLNLRMYGLGWFPEDPDGYNLYIMNIPAADSGTYLTKMNVADNDTMHVRQLYPGGVPTTEGFEITNTFDIYSWVMMDVRNIAPENGGDRVDVIQLEVRKDWMQVEPAEGVVDGDGTVDLVLTLDAADLPEARFEGELHFIHDGRDPEVVITITLDVANGPVQAVRALDLTPGWNLVSANLQPNERDVTVLTRALVEANQLVIMKDDEGHFYLPAEDFNNIPGWLVSEGYQMKVREAVELELAGLTVMPDDPIALEQGWQIVSYYPRDPIPAVTGFAGIAEHLIVAKDGDGNFYLPRFEFCNMEDLEPGQGYMLKTDAEIELIYQQPQAAAGRASKPMARPQHFASVLPTGADMSLLLMCGDMQGEAAVYSGELLVGSGVIVGGRCGVAVRGDDPTTPVRDGALTGEALSVRYWDGRSETDASIEPVVGKTVYQTDDIFVGKLARIAGLPTEFSISGAYPNPFNSMTRIEFGLPSTMNVQIRLYNASGRLAKEISDGILQAGQHQIMIDGSGLPSGVYLVRLESSAGVLKHKLLLLK